jgi:hypothetical protein
MCFSATASLVAGGVLSAAGAVTISQAKTKRELPLATIPLLFGIQQLIDGAVWLSFGVPLLNSVAAYAYGLFAFAFWPIFVPFALMRIETVKVRREIMDALLLVGLGVGLFFLYYIVTGAVTARVVNHCVAYSTPHPYRFESLAFYLLATAGPFFVSSKKMLNTFGVVLLLSFAIAGWFYIATFPSVWCFSAAIMSAMIYWYFRNPRRNAARP